MFQNILNFRLRVHHICLAFNVFHKGVGVVVDPLDHHVRVLPGLAHNDLERHPADHGPDHQNRDHREQNIADQQLPLQAHIAPEPSKSPPHVFHFLPPLPARAVFWIMCLFYHRLSLRWKISEILLIYTAFLIV